MFTIVGTIIVRSVRFPSIVFISLFHKTFSCPAASLLSFPLRTICLGFFSLSCFSTPRSTEPGSSRLSYSSMHETSPALFLLSVERASEQSDFPKYWNSTFCQIVELNPFCNFALPTCTRCTRSYLIRCFCAARKQKTRSAHQATEEINFAYDKEDRSHAN